mgnify:FL=1
MEKGILLVNKDINMTSHDVVNIVRRSCSMKRVGHTGTLDPMVKGVLPICIGKATRVSEFIMEQGKSYRGELTFGRSTTTYDAYGEETGLSDKKFFSKEEILEVFSKFEGEIEQVPPMYSAIKQDGKKLYDLARQGIEVERKKRLVTIYKFDVLEIKDDKVEFLVHCSKGTYIRSLVVDIAKELNTLAYMSHLERVSVGRFNLEDTIDINDIKTMDKEEIFARLIPIEDSLYNLEEIRMDKDLKNRLLNGQKINLSAFDKEKADREFIKVFSNDEFLGIGSIKKNILKMERVLY